jgi:hypothetical protein
MALSAAGLQVQQAVEWPVYFRSQRIALFEPGLVVIEGPVLIELKAKAVLEPHRGRYVPLRRFLISSFS